MKINFSEQEGIIRVNLSGELDSPASEEIQPVIDKLLMKDDHNFIIDCAELSYIASSGLRQLLSLKKATHLTGKTINLQNVQPAVKEVFSITNFDRLFGLK